MVIGFDVSKASVNWALVNKSGRIVKEGVCDNTSSALEALLGPLHDKYPSLVSCVESTGTCHLAVTMASERLRVPCRLINPIQTKQFTQATVRGTKTDKQDASYIALLGLQGAGYVLQPVAANLAQARAYLRLAHRLQGVHSQLEMMRQYLESCGLDLDGAGLVGCRNAVEATVKQYRTLAANLLADDSAVQLLQTIPGIGPVTAMSIVAEVGNVSRFKSAEQLIAYAGLDPRVKQSGQSSSTGRLTKRGSPYLRHWLFMAARITERYDPELREAYERRRAAGKSYTIATVAVTRKLVHRVYAVLKRGTEYKATSTVR